MENTKGAFVHAGGAPENQVTQMNSSIRNSAGAISLVGLGIACALCASNGIAAFGQSANTPTQAPAVPAAKGGNADSFAYPYKGPVFNGFIETSYKGTAAPPAEQFYPWLQDAYDRSHVRYKGLETITDLDALLVAVHAKYEAEKDPEQRTLTEKQTAAFLHRMIKKSIKHFSLDRGFEFADAVERGERQCFLQSTLLAGLMQRAGMSVGVVMVTKSDKGEESNNGHAVALVNLSNGRDVLVDVSHKGPFIRQQGIMVAEIGTEKYRFVAPQYDEGGDQIVAYAPLGKTGAAATPAQIHGLSVAFIESQFDYYRGERTPGGFFAKEKTPEGLADSEKFFTRSIQEDPRNPLPAYALGMVELRAGQEAEARPQLINAYHLYENYGYVPEGPQSALALVHAEPQTVSMR